MKNIITYNQFANEGIRDLMKPKSEDEILKDMGDLTPNELLKKSIKNNYLNGVKIALEKGADPSQEYNYAIRLASNNGHIEVVKLLLQDERVDPSDFNNYAIKKASENGHTEVVRLLLSDLRVDPSDHRNDAIRYASENGHTEVVKLLLSDSRVDPSDFNNYAIRYASKNGHTEIVKLLLQDKRVDPSKTYNYAIKKASENGHIEIVKLLLQDERVDPSGFNNYAIRYASENGHTEVVKLLLSDSRVDPSEDYNSAIKYASENGHLEIVKILLQDKRVREKLSDKQLKKYENQIQGLNESIRDLMKPKSKDEIEETFKKADVNSKKNMLRILVKQKFYTTEDFYKFIKSYINISTWNRLIKKGFERNRYDCANLVETIDKHELLKIFKALTYYKQDRNISESVRDLMKPKSEEDILKSIDNLSSEELLKKSCQLGLLNGVKLALEKGVDPSIDNNFAIEYASKNGHLEIVKLLLQDERVDPSDHNNYAIECASKNGHTEVVKLLLQDERVDPSDHRNDAIRYASENGHTEVVKLLLQDKRVDPSANYNYAIRVALEYGYIETVKLLLQDEKVREKLTDEEIKKYENKISGLNESVKDLMKGKSDEDILKSIDNLSSEELLKKSINNNYLNGVKIALEKGADPSQGYNYAIRIASLNGHLEIVKLLLKDERINPSDNRNDAINFASENGHTEIIKLLLQDPRVDPSEYSNYAIRLASENGHLEIVKLLLNDSRVRKKLTNEQIKKYKNQIQGLYESIRDLMKPKSEEEINDTIKELIKTNPERILMNYNFDFLLTIISKDELHDAIINFFKSNPEYALKNWDYKKLLTVISKKDIFTEIKRYAAKIAPIIKGFKGDETIKNYTNIIEYLYKKGYAYNNIDSLRDMWFKHKTIDQYSGGHICINGYITLEYVKDYIKKAEELSKRYK